MMLKIDLFQFVISPLTHYIKYARRMVFNDPYPPVQGQNSRSCFYMGEYGSVKACIPAHLMK